MSIRPHEWMTPKRRFLSGLFGGRVDRVPVASATSVTTLESMEATGAFFPEVHLDGEKMARLASADHDILGFDAIMPVFSGSQQGAALGCQVDWGTREMGGPVILHMCGDTLDRMDYVADSGIDCFHFSDKVDPAKARAAVGNRISLMGNINNVQTLLHGSPDDVKREAMRAIKAGVNILAPECAIPVAVRQANLRAIVEASIEASFAPV